jgi:hypothetical protein
MATSAWIPLKHDGSDDLSNGKGNRILDGFENGWFTAKKAQHDAITGQKESLALEVR